MSVLTKVALGDVVPSRRLGGSIYPLLTPGSVGASAGFLGAMKLAPGEFIAAHYHPHSEEFIFIAEGEVLLTAGGEELRLSRTEAAMVPKFTPHRIQNDGGEPALVVFQMAPLAPSPAEGHVEVEPAPNPDATPPSVGS
ncbi:cupin domain-containing protein [Streptomyces iranensis]|uniref:Cupin 2 conserved barrel domain protein n=1 Tax=Streptomyces iranensis TaxID=576784 RepID=A0A060ZTF2_9ACTN|nr:cupin domain-containing protein [Streptomyces iranensis]MBP2060871.1 putative monooxygenase [Streptomyces iranensis]CDR06332.1 Cupin 2 conserved barrel domain protein [Streptomyces iranensis]